MNEMSYQLMRADICGALRREILSRAIGRILSKHGGRARKRVLSALARSPIVRRGR